jgi:CDP-glucose 4,6-dehydratase
MRAQRNRVLVTGAAGFVGSWLCRRLVNAGHEVTGLVRSRPASDGLFARLGLSTSVTLHEIDAASLQERVATIMPDTIVNLAGQSQVSSANQGPSRTFSANTAFVWELLDAVRQLGGRPSIVHASSDLVYGETKGRPASEDDPAVIAAPYGASKVAGELVARCFVKTYHLPIVIARFGNIYGPGDPNTSRLIPDVMQRLSAGMPPYLRNGRAVRSYLYIDDAVDAILRLAEGAQEPGVTGEVFNVAGETGYSTIEVVQLARITFGREDIEPVVEDKAASEDLIKLSSIDKMTRMLGWRPTVSLAQGLKRMLVDLEVRP